MNKNDLKKSSRMQYLKKVFRSYGYEILNSYEKIKPDKELLTAILTGIVFDDIFYKAILKDAGNIAGFKKLSFNVHFKLKTLRITIEIEPVKFPTMDIIMNPERLSDYRMSNIKRLLPDIHTTQNEFARICNISTGRMFRILNEIFQPDLVSKGFYLIQFSELYKAKKQQT